MVVKPWTSVKTMVISWRAPPSSVEIELSTTRLTISLGTKRANDQIARCARFTVRPSSRISLTYDSTGEAVGRCQRLEFGGLSRYGSQGP